MKLNELDPTLALLLKAATTEFCLRLQAICGQDVDVVSIIHPQHKRDEECKGVSIVSNCNEVAEIHALLRDGFRVLGAAEDAAAGHTSH